MDAVDEIDDISEKVAANHPVDDAAENGGDHIPASIAISTLERTEISKKARPSLAIGSHGLLLVDEGNEFIAGDAVVLSGPISPTILSAKCRLP
jgi:hypothetical protein